MMVLAVMQSMFVFEHQINFSSRKKERSPININRPKSQRAKGRLFYTNSKLIIDEIAIAQKRSH